MASLPTPSTSEGKPQKAMKQCLLKKYFCSGSKSNDGTDQDRCAQTDVTSLDVQPLCGGDKVKVSDDVQSTYSEAEPCASTSKSFSSSQKYEKTRKRKFQQHWLKDFPWLDYSSETNKMSCTVCKRFKETADKSSVMYKGCSTFRIGTLQSHATNKAHLKCIDRDWEQNHCDEGPMVDAVRQCLLERKEKIMKLFNTAYYVAQKEKPFVEYQHLLDLQKKNGLDIPKHYTSDNACRRFIPFIFETLKKPQLQNIQNARVISVLADGSTDKSTVEQELVYIRYILDGEPVSQFLSIEEVNNGNAQGILQSIEGAFDRYNLMDWKDKLVGFGSDGAAVMIGCRNGVAALLKADIPWLIPIHCVAHRLELAVLRAIQDNEMFKKVKDVLIHIYKQYHFSPKQLREIKLIAAAMDHSMPKPSNLDGARWMPHHHKALKILLASYKPLVAHFEHIVQGRTTTADGIGRANSVLQLLRNYKGVYFCHFLSDVLEVLSILSQQYQKDDLTLSMALQCTENALLSLIALQHRPGEYVQRFLESVNQDGKFEGVELQHYDVNNHFHDIKAAIIDSVRAHISSRMDDIDKGHILQHAKVLDPAEWPLVMDRQQLATFGDHEIESLCDHFNGLLQNLGCDVNQLRYHEWIDLKNYLLRIQARHQGMKVVWKELFSVHKDRFPNILILVEIILVLPLSTSVCERGFSFMKRVKSDWRASLTTEMLRRLLFIAIEGPSLHAFDASLSFDMWLTGGKRRRRYVYGEAESSSDSENDS
uniref:zinc finger protein 862 n=1 Tax=Doryrhamphus excisus TaxID=161450 RepID=UPI0025AECD3A|nr:zinc finger protein 862 [Doryrhamphus excisus]